MFKRKRKSKIKKQEYCIRLLGLNDIIIYHGSFLEIPILEEHVLDQCIRFFQDHNPCYIHKTAVINRLTYEVEEYFMNNEEKRMQFSWDEIPENVKKIIKQPQEIRSIVIDKAE